MPPRLHAPALCVLLTASVVGAQVPEGWQKVSGVPETDSYSGIQDALDPVTPDRQNSYAWSMDVLRDYLYVGTNRNVFGLLVQATGQQKLPVYANSVTEFYYKAVDARITFQRDADGTVKRLLLHQNGQEMAGIRE